MLGPPARAVAGEALGPKGRGERLSSVPAARRGGVHHRLGDRVFKQLQGGAELTAAGVPGGQPRRQPGQARAVPPVDLDADAIGLDQAVEQRGRGGDRRPKRPSALNQPGGARDQERQHLGERRHAERDGVLGRVPHRRGQHQGRPAEKRRAVIALFDLVADAIKARRDPHHARQARGRRGVREGQRRLARVHWGSSTDTITALSSARTRGLAAVRPSASRSAPAGSAVGS